MYKNSKNNNNNNTNNSNNNMNHNNMNNNKNNNNNNKSNNKKKLIFLLSLVFISIVLIWVDSIYSLGIALLMDWYKYYRGYDYPEITRSIEEVLKAHPFWFIEILISSFFFNLDEIINHQSCCTICELKKTISAVCNNKDFVLDIGLSKVISESMRVNSIVLSKILFFIFIIVLFYNIIKYFLKIKESDNQWSLFSQIEIYLKLFGVSFIGVLNKLGLFILVDIIKYIIYIINIIPLEIKYLIFDILYRLFFIFIFDIIIYLIPYLSSISYNYNVFLDYNVTINLKILIMLYLNYYIKLRPSDDDRYLESLISNSFLFLWPVIKLYMWIDLIFKLFSIIDYYLDNNIYKTLNKYFKCIFPKDELSDIWGYLYRFIFSLHLFIKSNHDLLTFFVTKGRIYCLNENCDCLLSNMVGMEYYSELGLLFFIPKIVMLNIIIIIIIFSLFFFFRNK